MRHLVLAILLLALGACQSAINNSGGSADSAAGSAEPAIKPNPPLRDNVKKTPVAEYKVRTENKLNELYFSVQIYETPETMKYVAKVDYEGAGGEDSLLLPDLGIPPHPELQKGPEKYSCIIGFKDGKGTFRELKKVYVTEKGNDLKITTLKHYSFSSDNKLVGE